MDFQAALDFLTAGDELLLTTHVNADGDGLGALLGLSHWLEAKGQAHRIVVNDETPDQKFRFLPGFERIESWGALTDRSPVSRLVVVDTPTMSEKRIGHVANLSGAKTKTLVIDHHVGEDDEGDVQFLDSGASAASELVYLLIRADEALVTEAMATCLYAGIAFDTKLFKYSHPKRALAAAAELAECGADPQQVAEDLFWRQTYETVKALGIALSNMTLHADGQVSTLYVDHTTYTMGGDLDVVIDHAMSIDGVEVALFLKEEAPGCQRVSLRSRGKVDVNRAARQFDGGGHMRASGCTIEATVDEAREQLLAAVSEQL